MRTTVVTGAGSGIGKALAGVLAGRGERVIGVDIRDAEVIADLSTASGVARMVDEVARLSGGRIDAIAAGAGVGHAPPAAVIDLNFFGAVATLEGLRPLLAGSPAPRAAAISSQGVRFEHDPEIVEACLRGDRDAAVKIVEAAPDNAYPAAKKALSLWIRRESITAAWAGQGIALNAVAPGVTVTSMTQAMLDSAEGRAFFDVHSPMALGRPAQPVEVGEVLAFLLSPAAGIVIGQTLFCDMGADATTHPMHL